MADYDISKFIHFRRSGDITLTLYKKMASRASIGLIRTLIDMKSYKLEFLISQLDECICIKVISSKEYNPPFSRERILKEVGRYKQEIFSFMGVEPSEDVAMVMKGEVDYTQNAIFFPKSKMSLVQVKRKK